jgi:C-5 cytosine-specific DNA methylase
MSMFNNGLNRLILKTKPVRRDLLTVHEIARLQGFRDDFLFYNSEISQYKDALKALPPIVARRVALTILHIIQSSRVMRLDDAGEGAIANKGPGLRTRGRGPDLAAFGGFGALILAED